MNECNEPRCPARLSRLQVAGLRPIVFMAALALSASFPADANARGQKTTKASRMVDGQQIGKASWYGPGFHGKRTASGQPFNQNALTAAHPRLPLGSRAKITNLNNGREVEVTINDRGPHGGGRIIDLSRAAARQLGMGGSAYVSIAAISN